ncbi:MAG: acyl-CoA/acyl-ACP dehydrogenase, partial [Hellea sp.]|nr:acyl-CoA/acyl-ACP dehydrogenase [Hellea sp.]
MGLVLNEDESLLQDAAEGFFADKAPIKELRNLRDNRDEIGFSQALWKEMAEMGFTGVLVEEEYGGVDMGFMASGIIAEQMGRNLSASPFLSTAILAATAIREGGSDDQKSRWLPKISSGDAIIALALDERAKHNPDNITTTAERSGNGFRLNGSKAMVVDGHVADAFIVAAKTGSQEDGTEVTSLFLVDPNTNGISTERTIMLDSRNSARV